MIMDREVSELQTPDKQQGASSPRRSHGVLVAVVALLIVAAVVVAGIVPRRKAQADLKDETYDFAVPSVTVVHPKLGAPLSELVLPGKIEAFNDSPIYART